MRLLCPNCDAEYEVDAAAIPSNGRDVQCSNCGHAWFQQHPDAEADYDAEQALYDPPPPLPNAFETAAQQPAPEPVVPVLASDDPESILDAMGDLDDDLPNAQPSNSEFIYSDEPDFAEPDAPEPDVPESDLANMPSTDMPAQQIDPDALQILREEAARETAQRLAENAPQTLEQQTEMGLIAPSSSPIVARRVARLKGIQPAQVTIATPARDRLPAVDDINAALRSGDDLDPSDAQGQDRKTGSKAGFWAVILAAGTAAAGYVFSPEIAAKLPQIAGPIDGYVGFINGLRGAIDAAVAWISNLI